jgi:poly(hydroxyalkanoate) depolymerase family esterase
MKEHRRRRITRAAALGAFLLLAGSRAHAAKLSGPVTGWASGVPSYVSMYEYVPDKVANNPPLLVIAHYCSGSASGVFGEAQSGGIVAAADQYGFILILPQTTNNCWDVGTTPSLTHDGGGDTQAIAEMVTYAIAKHGANPNRVYVTGTSSGGMMTQALLAVYPDVFKAGAEFAGVPAGCWSASYSASNQWSGPCAGGQVTHTAQQWGDLVRGMDSGYSGSRPRVQLWHGTADPTIDYANFTEAIKEWTNVLGLGETATSTTMVSLSNHQWTRQSWQDSCGNTVLDAWAEQNGPHGTDANLNAMYVIPFLGLDKTGATDPDQCGAGGMGGNAGQGTGGNANGGRSSGAGGNGASSGSSGAGAGLADHGGNGGSSGRNTTGGTGGNAIAAAGSGLGGGNAGATQSGAGGSRSGAAGLGGGSAGVVGSSGATSGGGGVSGVGGGAGSSHAGAGALGMSGASETLGGDSGESSPSSGCSCGVADRRGTSAALVFGTSVAFGVIRRRKRQLRA